MNIRNIYLETVSCVFIVLFTYAAISKLIDHESFIIQLGQSPLFTSVAIWVSWIVPAVEIMVSIGLALPGTRMVALYASFTLMVLFTAYIIAILNLDGHIPCSCGGVLESMGWKEHLVFNIGFTLLAMGAVMVYPDKSAGVALKAENKNIHTGKGDEEAGLLRHSSSQ